MGGLFDVLPEDSALRLEPEDIGLVFAEWGLGHGPYLVLPIIGPSSVRDGIGRGFAILASPTFISGQALDLSSGETIALSGSYFLAEAIDTRAGLLDAVSSAKDASLDYYLFTRAAYYQLRRSRFYDGSPPDTEDAPDDFDEDEFEREFADELR